MDIVVLNGSPKGELSVTRQYIEYLNLTFPQHRFNVINIGKNIKSLENKHDHFNETMKEISNADALMWCFPVYACLIPYQLKKFIELVEAREFKKCFEGKYATSISTSAHFYDHTAHNYIHQISYDWDMQYLEGYSAEMNDLLKPEERKNLSLFFEDFLSCVENQAALEQRYIPINPNITKYIPSEDIQNIPLQNNKKVILLNDITSQDHNLAQMVNVFSNLLPMEVKNINLHEVTLKGGCLGCIRCGYDGTCVYNDDMQYVLEELKSADAIIIAATIKDRYLSSRWKLFFDRSFCNGHRPVNMGKQIGYIISGPLKQLPNLREILQAMAEVGRMNLVGYVTDEYNTSEEITALLKTFAQRLLHQTETNAAKPKTFLGVGGHLIFRDLIYNMRGIFRQDHIFYKKHGLYDFPQRNIKNRLVNNIFQIAMVSPKLRKTIFQRSENEMIRAHQRVLQEIQNK